MKIPGARFWEQRVRSSPEADPIPLLQTVTPDNLIFRISRRPDPWQPPDWARAGADGTFSNRFDDPQAIYRALYASSQRLGCFLETLARFRRDPSLLAELGAIEGVDDFTPLGLVPSEWRLARLIGSATTTAQYADICSTNWISALRLKPGAGFGDLDVSIVLASAPRSTTQRLSRAVYEQHYDGIHYPSKQGYEIDNWAIFEPFPISPLEASEISGDDRDLLRALELHALKLGA